MKSTTTESNISIWNSIFRNNSWGKYPPESLIRCIARNFFNANNRNEVKVLELGAGAGANLWFLCREGFSTYGIEGSEIACEKVRSYVESEGLCDQLKALYCGDYYEKLNLFEDDLFDAIIDIESLYCNSFERSREVILKAYAKLRAGGKFFSITFDKQTTGFDGEEVGFHATLPIVGPCANKGFSRYTTKDDIDKLYATNEVEVINIEKLFRTSDDQIISEWIIELQKK